MAKAKEDLRENPEVRAVVRDVLNRQMDAVVEAEALLAQALEKLAAVPYQHIQDELFQRVVSQTRRAAIEAGSFTRFWDEPPTETYVGNKAAFELGEAIKKDLDKGTIR